jgi:hypothetical protein
VCFTARQGLIAPLSYTPSGAANKNQQLKKKLTPWRILYQPKRFAAKKVHLGQKVVKVRMR